MKAIWGLHKLHSHIESFVDIHLTRETENWPIWFRFFFFLPSFFFWDFHMLIIDFSSLVVFFFFFGFFERKRKDPDQLLKSTQGGIWIIMNKHLVLVSV
ncbi:hypothetical protein ACSBR2_010320 [Camellia fascicularis]